MKFLVTNILLFYNQKVSVLFFLIEYNVNNKVYKHHITDFSQKNNITFSHVMLIYFQRDFYYLRVFPHSVKCHAGMRNAGFSYIAE